MFELDGKVALLTGACQWLGRDMAEVFAEHGCSVIVTSRSAQKAQSAAAEIAAAHQADTLGLQLDVHSIDSIESVARAAHGWKGRIDILVNNAGGGSGASEGNLFDRSYEDIRNMISSNLTGVIFLCKAVGRYMKEAHRGKIINIGSIAGLVGRDRGMYYASHKMEQPTDYAAAKGGVIAFTRDLAAVMAPFGVNVNCISPGGFDKGDLPDEFVRRYSERTAVGRMGAMGSDIKGAALFLATDASDYVTGQNLIVDGGFTIWH